LGELLRIGSRSSQLRVPTVLKQDSQGFPNGSVHYSGTTLYFCGYFNEFPCFSRVDFFHVERDAQFEINEQSLRGPLVSGSEIVADQMYRDPRDPRFSAFVLERGQSPSLETATQFARGYIEACSSPLGLEVDALICKGIGGHLHMATITKSGFTWVIEPVPQ
jgi:hypothetical protein